MPEARWLSDEETLTYLHDCISDRAHRVAVPDAPFHLDALLPDAPLVGGLAPHARRADTSRSSRSAASSPKPNPACSTRSTVCRSPIAG